ncbi:hypothetical protein DRN67_00580 [Candidatus Micrarchaeota archaeon]|nr:MAG: hypothetical protein DRN67_00580 [Candidatus Micrarchaeota archaeon]
MDLSKNSTRHTKKGFFFSGAVAILLVLLIASTTLWLLYSQSKAQRAPLLTQGQNLQNFEQSLLTYNERALQVGAELSLFETNKRIFDTQTLYNTEANLQNYFCTSSSNPSNLEDAMNDWRTEVIALGDELGLDVDISFGTCQISMADFDTVQVDYPISYTITDRGTGVTIEDDVSEPALIDINGYDDALVFYSTYNKVFGHAGEGMMKQIWFNEDLDTLGELQLQNCKGEWASPCVGLRGKGWFYGKTTDFWNPVNDECYPDADEKKSCIAVVYDIGVVPDFDKLNEYGAIIVVGEPTDWILGYAPPNTPQFYCPDAPTTPVYIHEDTEWCLDCLRYSPTGLIQGECENVNDPLWKVRLGVFAGEIDVPFITVPSLADSVDGFDPAELIGKYLIINSGTWHNTISGHPDQKRLWTVENLRAVSVCGFYVNNPRAPNFLQRMTDDWISDSFAGDPNGIESFLITKHIPNVYKPNLPADADVYSNIDYIAGRYLLAPTLPPVPDNDEHKAKAMPGCKTWEQCSYFTSVGQGCPFGHFAFDDLHWDDYDPADRLACIEGGVYASCEDNTP